MKKKYTKKQITEAIAYWEKQLRAMNESNDEKIFLKKDEIPQTLNYYDVIDMIKDSPELTYFEVPYGVETIGREAFSGVELKTIVIPDSVKKIDNRAFKDCYTLERVVIGKNVVEIGQRAFFGCTRLKELVFKGKTFDKVVHMEYYPWGILGDNESFYQSKDFFEKAKRIIRCKP